MTYAEYVAFLLRFLWREFDTDLEADAEFYIRAAEARLSRDLKVQRLETPATVVFTATALEMPYPSTIKRISLITDDATGKEVKYVLPARMAVLRSAEPGHFLPFYTTVGRNMRFVGFTPSRDFLIDYCAQIPSLKTDDTSWVLDTYFDLYNAAVLCQAVMALKSDQRKQMFENDYRVALDSVISEDANDSFDPTQGNMPEGVW